MRSRHKEGTLLGMHYQERCTRRPKPARRSRAVLDVISHLRKGLTVGALAAGRPGGLATAIQHFANRLAAASQCGLGDVLEVVGFAGMKQVLLTVQVGFIGGVYYSGRNGDLVYIWTDESFMRGGGAAEKALSL
jgi:hypothetical protein